MKILVISDTHGYQGDLRKICRSGEKFDLLIHCGDVEGGEHEIRELSGCPCYFVKGNCDYFSDLPSELLIPIGAHKIFVTHGHLQNVGWEKLRLELRAYERGADVVLFGHTHYPELEEADGLTFVNPGSLSKPRQPGRKGSYLVMEVSESGELTYEHRYLES